MTITYIKTNDTNPDSEFRKLLDLIPEGKERAIPMPVLANYMHFDEITLKHFICRCRKEGNIICSSSNGYYFPADVHELEDFYIRMMSRKTTTEKVLKPVEKLLKEEGRLE